MKKIVISVIVGALCVVLLGFGLARDWKDRSCELALGLHSYESQRKAQRVLHAKGALWQVVDQSDLLVTDPRPRFSNQTVLVHKCSHLGVQGDVLLYFFNDRLMKTEFFPVDMQKYRQALADQESIVFSADLEAHAEPATRIWIGKDEQGRFYVGWVDERLWQEHVDWIKNYS